MNPTLPVRGWRLAALMLLSGAFAALSLPPVCALFVLPLGLLVLYRAAEDARSWKQAALCGFLFGMGFHIAGLYWLTNAILTRVHEFWWVVPFASPGVSLIIAPLVAVPAVLCRLVPAGWRRVLMFSGSWTLVDMGRVFLFSGFPWNPLGSDLEFPGVVGDAFIQPASLIGVDGITLFVVLGALTVFRSRRAASAVLIAAILWGGWGYWRLETVQPLDVVNPRAVLVQGNVSEDEIISHQSAIENFRRYLRLTSKGVQQARDDGSSRPVVVIWPESGFPGLLDEDELARQMIEQAASGAPSLIGSDREKDGHWFNSLEAVAPDGHIEAIYDKSRLVPFGEYQPWILPFNILPGVITPGPGLRTWTLPDIGSLGPMVCYEIIFSGSVTERHKRPNWLLTISNDAWYGNSAGPRQHLATGRMRAVEEGLPVVFANNTGISAVYDGRGHEVSRLGWGLADALVTDVPPPLKATLFSRWGRAIPASLAILFMLLAFIPRRGQRAERVVFVPKG
ncbi:apolipoprotein N-acyltransferase [Gluconobacter wancherniae]|uniref:Apolipoprotein N-acyltransferase n=1 Tax=Gluconobacter wancherniae NBRC 103581 TaxID=656744 RepID=A0A511B2T6_9PROT|nr:apolipoprotein N-acyltransferase [Gluconobacter wancherniae]MBF0854893.1 apolipoprotein N-acyltransferase [Gluconobacter wancherniae]MBS1064016.1 apolipoprotein N-acyltransferase [Gluconobacter wancherniae]GBD57940.1 apolipoprotein N-acyltransferase [Gluconobacter wancherniae NBRC 103581]GBR65750.1 apolipoprotein N-acyltransferase [Gluconobacter wancherniae NBRC 103581]GEK94769.1 apolipoprotein N-acyltransferase [Gluconobacter wancherniae NBRC 103581]